MKKLYIYILLFVPLIFITGCTPEYNLTIKNTGIKEELIIYDDSENISERFKNLYSIVEDENTYIYKKNGNKTRFTYNYSFDKIAKSNIIKSCYNAYNFFKEEDHYVLQTGSKFECFPLQVSDNYFINYEELNINIKVVDFEVLEENADEINGNIYKWKINKNNYNNKPIILKIKGDLKTTKDTIKNEKSYFLIYVLLFITIIGFIFLIIIFLLNKKRNNI